MKLKTQQHCARLVSLILALLIVLSNSTSGLAQETQQEKNYGCEEQGLFLGIWAGDAGSVFRTKAIVPRQARKIRIPLMGAWLFCSAWGTIGC